jgi:hypothetical protein
MGKRGKSRIRVVFKILERKYKKTKENRKEDVETSHKLVGWIIFDVSFSERQVW